MIRSTRVGSRNRLRPYVLVLDDKRVATLRPGESAEIEVEPGAHIIQAKVGPVLGSAPLRVTLENGDIATLLVRHWGGLPLGPVSLLTRRDGYLILERTPPAGPLVGAQG